MPTHADRYMSYGDRRPQTMLRDGPLLTGCFDAVAGYGCERLGGTTDWLLFCTVAGGGVVRHLGGDLRVGPGTLVRYAPGTRQDYRTDPAIEQWRFHWIHWLPRPELLPLLVWPEPAPGIGLLTIADADVFTRIADRIADADMRASGGAHHGDLLALNALEEALLWSAEHNPLSPSHREGRLDPRLRAAVERVARDLAHPWDVASLAAIAGLSTSRFANRFRACLGEPPRRWLERMRLERARRLLRDGDLAIQVVAAQVGYTDPLHFADRYRARWGHAPSHERRGRPK